MFKKALKHTCICRFCKKNFKCADVKGRYCDVCKLVEKLCGCGCGGTIVGAHRQYLPFHHTHDMTNSRVRLGHVNQGKQITGLRNPAKRESVRGKISKAMMGRVMWKEGKNAEQIAETRKRMNFFSLANYPKKYLASDGQLYRSSLEVATVEILRTFGTNFVYEKKLPIRGNCDLLPDFTLEVDGELRCLLEVTGSAYDKWAEHFIERAYRIRRDYPNLPIVVITYPDSVFRLKKILSVPFVRVFALGDAVKETQITTLLLESDHFNFDYSHFLPWHTGQCADFHGHSSTVSVAVRGWTGKNGMVADFGDLKKIVKDVIGLVDHKVLVPSYTVKKRSGKNVEIEFTSKNRHHLLVLPNSEVMILDKDSTVEHISYLLAELILDSMPQNVTDVAVKMNEGIGKAAVSTATIVGRDLGPVNYIGIGTETKESLFRALAFYHLPMVSR